MNKSLKQMLILQSIANNTVDENLEIHNKILSLRFKCGCKQFKLKWSKISSKMETCNSCMITGCKHAFLRNYTVALCMNCIKNEYIGIALKNNFLYIKTKLYIFCLRRDEYPDLFEIPNLTIDRIIDDIKSCKLN